MLIMMLGLSLSPYVICSVVGTHRDYSMDHTSVSEPLMGRKRFFGGILQNKNLRAMKEKKSICYPFSFLIRNVKPVGHQVYNCLN